MVSKNKRQLTAAQLQALLISISEARKILGDEAKNMSDEDVARAVLSLNELAVFLTNNMNLHKMHL